MNVSIPAGSNSQSITICNVNDNGVRTSDQRTDTITPTNSQSVSDNFLLTNRTDANGRVRFGVAASQPGTVNITALFDTNGNATDGNQATGRNGVDPGEPQASATQSVVLNRGADSAAKITAVPTSGQSTTTQAGSNQASTYTVTVTDANGVALNGITPKFVNTSGPNAPTNPDQTQATSCQTPTNNQGQTQCVIPAPGTNDGRSGTQTQSGTETYTIFVDQSTSGSSAPNGRLDPNEPQTTVTRDVRSASTMANRVTISPNGQTLPSGQRIAYTAIAVDQNGNPVPGVSVIFSRSGIGDFTADEMAGPNGTVTRTTNNDGRATVTTISAVNEQGSQSVTARITGTTACPNQNSTSQNCTATGTNTLSQNAPSNGSPSATPSGTASPGSTATPTPTATSTVTPTPSSTASTGMGGTISPTPSGPANPACVTPASVTLAQSTIIATGSAGLTVKASANSVIDLFAYTRPSTAYRMVRSAEVGADGSASFRIVPPANTRLYAQQRGCNASPTVVLNVRTALSLFAKRNGTRNYTFSGDSLPARSGGLIVSLYRVTDSGRQVLTSQARANASNGEYVINRVFTGEGRFGFVVRTGQDLRNAPGSSNIRPTLVY